MAMLSKRAAEMVPSMVAHLHTVLRLHQRGPQQLAWLEYDIQFRMKMAASADRAWTCGDPWQYISCLPGQGRPTDPFSTSELGVPGAKGKGKRPPGHEEVKGLSSPSAKRARKGVCRLHNTAPRGCPYGSECLFIHWCNGCGAMEDHGCVLPGCGRTPSPGSGGSQPSIGIQGATEEVTSWR